MKYEYGFQCASRGLQLMSGDEPLRARLESVMLEALEHMPPDVIPGDLHERHRELRQRFSAWEGVGDQSGTAATLALMTEEDVQALRTSVMDFLIDVVRRTGELAERRPTRLARG